MIDPSLEAPRPLDGAGASDAVTVSFGDEAAGVFGIARVGRSRGDDGEVVASGLGLLFADGQVVEVRAEGGKPVEGDGWEGARAGGVRTAVVTPLKQWTVAFDGDDGTLGFELELVARSAPAALPEDGDVAKLGGMHGYEQLVAVQGTVRAGGAARKVRGLGQRGHSWGAPDWDKLSLARTVNVWLDDGVGVTATAVRAAKAKDHGSEALGVALWPGAGEDGTAPREPLLVGDPRLSTTYDADGRQQAAGFELYLGEDDPVPHRAAGEVVVGTTLDLGRLRLDTAFLRWRMEGRTGIGRYDLLRRTDA